MNLQFSTSPFMKMFKCITRNVNVDHERIATESLAFTLPVFLDNDIVQLCRTVASIFERERSMISVDSPVVIVGDLHGHFLDLLRILKNHGLPPETHYLFLGDLVDRGEFSLETVECIFIMKVLFPDSVHIIRGNHEFNQMCNQFGFYEELTKVYHNASVYSSFLEAFSKIPYAALVGGKIFCVHAGIGPSVKYLQDIQRLQKPIDEYSNDIVNALVWSDPKNGIENFEKSQRGLGYSFGDKQLAEFLGDNKITTMVRGHECVQNGYRTQFDQTLYTVFSASNYCGEGNNKSAVLQVDGNLEITPIVYEAFTYLKRMKAYFSRPISMYPPVEQQKTDNDGDLSIESATNLGLGPIAEALAHITMADKKKGIHSSVSVCRIPQIMEPLAPNRKKKINITHSSIFHSGLNIANLKQGKAIKKV